MLKNRLDETMKFGYFTLSDNRYPEIARPPEQFILEIREQAIHADKLGYHEGGVLYFNAGGKPHAMVMEQMERFQPDIAPAFA